MAFVQESKRSSVNSTRYIKVELPSDIDQKPVLNINPTQRIETIMELSPRRQMITLKDPKACKLNRF